MLLLIGEIIGYLLTGISGGSISRCPPQQRGRLVVELAKANDQVTILRAAGEKNANKLANALDRIVKLLEVQANEVTDLRQQLVAAEKQATPSN